MFVLVAGGHNVVFYDDDGRIAGCNSIWLQTTLTAGVTIFKRMVLLINLGDTKSMMFTLGFIWGQQGAAAYKRRAMV